MNDPAAFKGMEAKSFCVCGHKSDGPGSDHMDLEMSGVVFDAGHGRCTVPGCKCLHFVWKEFTPQTEQLLGNLSKLGGLN